MDRKPSDGAHDLARDAAVEKIREIARCARVCLFGTIPGKFPLEVRPMVVEHVDEAGVLWFLSGRSSEKNHDISRDSRVQLLFANPGSSQYLSLNGTAYVSDDRPLRERYWNPLARAWFPGGVDDPELTVIRVWPEGGHYWDTEHGKTVSLVEIAVAAMTGQPTSTGIQGRIEP